MRLLISEEPAGVAGQSGVSPVLREGRPSQGAEAAVALRAGAADLPGGVAGVLGPLARYLPIRLPLASLSTVIRTGNNDFRYSFLITRVKKKIFNTNITFIIN